MSRLIIPILNSRSALLPGPAHYLDSRTKIDKLGDAEFGLVSKTPPEFAQRFRTEHRCIFVELPNSNDVESITAQVATKVRYVLNNFMHQHALLLEFAVHLETIEGRGRTIRPRTIVIGEDLGTLLEMATPYSVKPGTKRENMSQFYVIVSEACDKHKRLLLTLSRFNSALTRAKTTDKIIDATISLESMVQDDKNELNFKFALFNAFAGTKDPLRRLEVFNLLKKLYRTRSLIVHGAADEAKEQSLVSEIESSWSELEDISRRVINEFIFFTKANDPRTWTQHLLEKILLPEAISAP